VTTPQASTSPPLVAPGVKTAELFARAEAMFRNEFEIERVVAASPTRVLLVARDIILKRRVTLRIHLQPRTLARAWFERENELLAGLDHAVLRPIYAAGYRGNWAHRVGKWIEGESLASAVERGPRPIPSVLQLTRDLTSFLEYVHSNRIVVRRIVPTTLMLEFTGRNIVTDLRFASPCLAFFEHDEEWTLPYLAPEVRDGGVGEPASDVYTAAALLYFAVTGRDPALEPGTSPPPRQLRPACPRALERVILRALQADPAERYFSAAEMDNDLVSDLGDFDHPIPVVPPLGATTEDARAWEQRLRRALGDDYELLDELGAGGFGRVYRVRDLALEREVALKVLHPFLTADPAVVERFRREAQVAAQWMHPHIVNIYDIGGRAGLLWYTMEYVAGMSLARLVEAEGPQPLDRVARWLGEALSALEEAHARGLVHRDLKPENLLIERGSGKVMITDFGLVLALEDPRRGTGAGSHSGTPEYAAPEQLLGEPVDHRADLYSLTLCAYYALIGQSPLGSGPLETILARHAVGQLPDLRKLRPDIPDDVVALLGRGAARHPATRIPSAQDYRQALQRAVRRWRLNPLRLVRRAFRRRPH
jgi:serine/threonine protein kinase